jgi:hypothetical protein
LCYFVDGYHQTLQVPISDLSFQASKIEETALNGSADHNESGPKKNKNKKKNKKPTEEKEKEASEAKEVVNGNEAVVEENGEGEENETEDASKGKKKRNRPKKKKTEESKQQNGGTPKGVQTDPPTIPISELFNGSNYPVGQEMEYPIPQDDLKAKDRFSSEEKRALDRLQLDMYNEIRQVRIDNFSSLDV